MKKILFVICAVAAFASCTKPELTGSEPGVTGQEQPGKPKKGKVYRVGDQAYDALGWGYDVTQEWANASYVKGQVIDVTAVQSAYPARVIVDNIINTWQWETSFSSNAQSYSMTKSSKVDASLNLPVFGAILNSAFNAQNSTTSKYDGQWIYASHDLVMKDRRIRFNAANALLQNYVTAEFLDDLNNWFANDIPGLVAKYGTHVCADFVMGAKMDVMYQATTESQSRDNASTSGVKLGVDKVFGLGYTGTYNSSYASSNQDQTLWVRTRGGNYTLGPIGSFNLAYPITTPLDFGPWQNSVNSGNVQMIDFTERTSLILLYDLIADATKKAAVKAYIDQYLIDHGVYMEYQSSPVYKYYNAGSGDHMYQTIQGTYANYVYEAVAFNAFKYQVPNSVPIYRYFTTVNGDHFYTANGNTPGGYVSEGIAFYAFLTAQPGTVPIYKFYSNITGDHYYRQNPAVPGGYVSEGIAFYAFP